MIKEADAWGKSSAKLTDCPSSQFFDSWAREGVDFCHPLKYWARRWRLQQLVYEMIFLHLHHLHRCSAWNVVFFVSTQTANIFWIPAMKKGLQTRSSNVVAKGIIPPFFSFALIKETILVVFDNKCNQPFLQINLHLILCNASYDLENARKFFSWYRRT